MNGATLNTAWLDTSVLSATRLNTVGTAGRKGGSTPPEPGGEDAWLWGDGTAVLWGDGSTVLIEQDV